MAGTGAKRGGIVPEAHKALDRMKYEIAAELGLPIQRGRPATAGGMSNAASDAEFAAEPGAVNGESGSYWGFVSSRDAGAVGGRMTLQLVRRGEQDLFR